MLIVHKWAYRYTVQWTYMNNFQRFRPVAVQLRDEIVSSSLIVVTRSSGRNQSWQGKHASLQPVSLITSVDCKWQLSTSLRVASQ